MFTFKEFTQSKDVILEAATAGDLKLHLTHMEDLAVEEGKEGFKKFDQQVTGLLKYIKGLDSDVNTSIKIDGAPAIYFGSDPRLEYKGQFFVAMKGGFNKTPKINHNDQDIDRNHGHSAGLPEVLKSTLRELKKVYDGSGLMYHGDLLFSSHDQKKVAKIDGVDNLWFKPNVIVYAVPVDPDSELYNRVKNASVGIVVHAGYHAELNADGTSIIPRLSKRQGFESLVNSGIANNVFVEDSSMHRPLNFEFNPKQVQAIREQLSDSARNINGIDDDFDRTWVNSKAMDLIKIYLNSQIRSPGGGIFQAVISGEDYNHEKFVKGFSKFIDERFKKEAGKRKSEAGKMKQLEKRDELLNFLERNYTSFEHLMKATYNMMQIKKTFLKIFDSVEGKLGKMFTIGDDGVFEPSKGEGFVVSAGTNQIKLLDRLDFSRKNFMGQGEFQKK
jgi:hypothetical protein